MPPGNVGGMFPGVRETIQIQPLDSSIRPKTRLCFGALFWAYFLSSLQKHAYSNILKILPPKNENFQKKV